MTALVGGVSLAIILFWPLVTKRVPGSIVALLAGTMLAVVFKLPVETIGTKFGGIPTGLPAFHIPEFRADLIMPLLPSAMTVALLAAVESLLSAVVADGMSGDKHNSNVELMAQGVANLVTPLVRRYSGDGGDRAHGDQHPQRREDACVGNHPRANVCWASCWWRRRWRSLSRWLRSRRCCSWSPTTWASGERWARSCA